MRTDIGKLVTRLSRRYRIEEHEAIILMIKAQSEIYQKLKEHNVQLKENEINNSEYLKETYKVTKEFLKHYRKNDEYKNIETQNKMKQIVSP